jgi:hypothetical protein
MSRAPHVGIDERRALPCPLQHTFTGADIQQYEEDGVARMASNTVSAKATLAFVTSNQVPRDRLGTVSTIICEARQCGEESRGRDVVEVILPGGDEMLVGD